jgi:hypothetical protein
MVKISGSITVTTTDPTTIAVAVEDYILFLRRLRITNSATTSNTITVAYMNGDTPKPVLTAALSAGEEKTFREDELPAEAAPTAIVVQGTAQPYVVDFSIEMV